MRTSWQRQRSWLIDVMQSVAMLGTARSGGFAVQESTTGCICWGSVERELLARWLSSSNRRQDVAAWSKSNVLKI